MPSSRANRRGIVALVVSMAAFSTNDALIKLAAKTYPLGEVVFVRGLITSALAAIVVLALGHYTALRGCLHPRVLGRAAMDATATLLFTQALIHMPMAELSAVVLVSPLILTAMGVLLYGEEVGWRRWIAVAVGFAGTMFVVKPTPAAFDAWALLGIAVAFVGASRDLVTRGLDPGIPTSVVTLTSSIAVTLAGLGLGVTETWKPVALPDLGLMAAAAALLGIGFFMSIVAFRGADVSAIAPFRYSILLWASIAGYVTFGELPDRWGIIGASLIVASGLYALHREVVRQRELTARVTPVP